MIIHDVEQGTTEWLRLRMGKFTASNFATLFMKPETQGYNNLINQIVFERLTGELPETYSNGWMDRGKELEPYAREAYEFLTFNMVKQVGFVEQDEWVGCSPDGLIDSDGILEIKCPKFSTLISYHLSDNPENDYRYQIQGQLAITQRQWCDYFVYHPKLKPILKRIYPDEKIITSLMVKLNEAIELVKERIEKINQ